MHATDALTRRVCRNDGETTWQDDDICDALIRLGTLARHGLPQVQAAIADARQHHERIKAKNRAERAKGRKGCLITYSGPDLKRLARVVAALGGSPR